MCAVVARAPFSHSARRFKTQLLILPSPEGAAAVAASVALEGEGTAFAYNSRSRSRAPSVLDLYHSVILRGGDAAAAAVVRSLRPRKSIKVAKVPVSRLL